MWPPFAVKITPVLLSIFVQSFLRRCSGCCKLFGELATCLLWIHSVSTDSISSYYTKLSAWCWDQSSDNTFCHWKYFFMTQIVCFELLSCCRMDLEQVKNLTWYYVMLWTFVVPDTFAKYCTCIYRERKQLWSVSAVKETITREHICRFLSVCVHIFLSTNHHRSSTMKLAY